MEQAIENAVIICKVVSRIIPPDSLFEWDVVRTNGHFLISVRKKGNSVSYNWSVDNSLKIGQLIQQNLVIDEFYFNNEIHRNPIKVHLIEICINRSIRNN